MTGKQILSRSVCIVVCIGIVGCRSNSSEKQRNDRIEAMYREYRKQFPGVPDVSAAELPAMQKTHDVVLIDVRQDAEQDVSMIRGAVRDVDFRPDVEKYRGKRIVTYCTIGLRSGRRAAELRKAGFDAYNLRGGILAWVHARREIVDKQGVTLRVHVYGRKWNLVPDDYRAVW